MSTYKALVGKKIKSVSSDPSDSVEGQMWYNSTTQSLRGLALVSAWASAAPMITARGYGAANGTQTASLYTGGLEPGGTYYSNTEEYNGSGWSTGGALPKQNYAAGSAGTQTAALFFGGSNNPGGITINTYTYNGSSWTATPNSLNLGRDYICGTGTQTSALAYCGRVTSPSLAVVANFEEWNGSSWTALTAAPTAVAGTMGNGPETAAFFASGGTDNGGPPYLSTTQEYNGSTLSAGGNVNTGRAFGGAAGDSSAGLIFGGDAGGTSQTKTETYDGTSFSEIADMATAMRGMGNGAGATNAAAVAASSYGPPALGTTEEFTASTNVITGAAWASGGNLNNARNNIAGCGSQTASLCAGGDSPEPVYDSYVEEYNGTSWSEVTNIPTNNRGAGMAGIQTAAVYFGGETHFQTPVNAALLYDGSSWTSTGTMPYNANYAGVGGTGTQTAALGVGGYVKPPHTDAVIEFNGSTWSTNPNSYPTAVGASGHCGTQTAALLVGGYQYPPAAQLQTSNTYDGSSFSSAPNLIYSHAVAASSGTQTDAIVGTGQTGPLPNDSNQAQGYDGTSWATRANLSVTRRYAASGKNSAPASAAWIAGGYMVSPAANTNSTEEFTGETTAANVETFSTS